MLPIRLGKLYLFWFLYKLSKHISIECGKIKTKAITRANENKGNITRANKNMGNILRNQWEKKKHYKEPMRTKETS